MAIDWQRPEFETALPDWQLVDKVADEKDLGDLLPTLNAHDTSEANKQRNKFYRERASWFGATSITEAGLIGVAFEEAPEIDLPSALEYLRTNCDGEGVDLQQQMQDAVKQVLRKGRCGLFTTYPQTDGTVSVAEQEAGNAVATVHIIDAKRIINWWLERRGAQVILGGVVFTDTRSVVTDYEVEEEPTLRELALEDGRFVDRTWVKAEGGSKWEVAEEYYPTDGAGNAWTVIPFTFVGALNNTSHIDRAPLLSLARLNRDHYRNSADNEESVWYAGQAQPFLKPSEHDSPDDLSKAAESGFYIGSRMLVRGEIGFAQADPNTAVRQAMIDKQDAMKAIGARFLQPGTVAKTATESSGEQKVSHSVLSLVVANVEDAYNAALRFVAQWMNSPEASVAMSRAFMDPQVTVEMIDRIVSLLDRGAVGYADVLPALKRAKLIDGDKTPEEYLEEVAERGGMMGPADDAA